MMKKYMMIVAVILGLATLTGCGPSQGNIEKVAKSWAERRLLAEKGLNDAKCKEVKITQKIDSRHYKATVRVEKDGNESLIPISIEILPPWAEFRMRWHINGPLRRLWDTFYLFEEDKEDKGFVLNNY